MKEIVKNIIRIFIGAYIIAFFLVIITFLLPNNIAWKNIEKSNIKEDNLNSFLQKDSYSNYIDYSSDMHIIGELYYRDEKKSLIQKAMYVYGPDKNPIKETTKYIQEKDKKIFTPYFRYWHGNLFIFKILFSIFTYSSIKIFSLFIQLFLIIKIIKKMLEKNLKEYIFAFLTSILLINPVIMSLSLQYYACYFIMLISVLLLLKYDKLLLKEKLIYYFFIVGMATSYLDLLSFPLLTLGIPLIFVYIIKGKESLKNILLYIFIWSLGYIGLWFMKWLTMSIVFHMNAFQDAFDAIAFRTSSHNFNRFLYFLYPLKVFKEPHLMLLLIYILLTYIYIFWKKRVEITLNDYKNNKELFLIMILPILWFLICTNHSCVHPFFSHRLLTITIFAFQCFLIRAIYKKNTRA